jgi:Fe2+ transport system protein FeoA
MNIREGKTIKKVISQPFRGPTIIEIDNRQCAIGRGMTRKILVEEK